jgi:flagellar basal body-associated protein FliL
MSSSPPEAATDERKDVEKQSESTGHENDASGQKKSFAFPKWIVLIVIIVCIVCAITLPLTLRNRDMKESKAEDNSYDSPSNKTNSTQQNNSSTIDDVPVAETGSNRTERSYQNVSIGPVTSSLELFNTDITKGYTNDEDLESDLMNAAKYLLGVQYTHITSGGQDNLEFADKEVSGGDLSTTVADSPLASVGSGSSKLTGSDFGTNNQEQGVEEGDILVSDGQYGTYITVFCCCICYFDVGI